MPSLPLFRIIAGTVFLIAVPTALTFLTPVSAPSPCPASFHADPPRTARLLSLLASVPEGARIAQSTARENPPPTLCYGAIAVPAITPSHVLLLNPRHPEPESAARIAHLFTHLLEGIPMHSPAPGDCHSRLDHALSQEAHAFAAELRIRKALGIRPSSPGTLHALPFEFEGAFFDAPEPEREPLIKRYLQSHPNGAPGMDPLASAYLKRCTDSSTRPAPSPAQPSPHPEQ